MVSDFRRRKYTALFEHLDNNHDGVIDLTDWDRYAELMRKEMGWPPDEPRLASLIETAVFPKLDLNGDGVVELDEMMVLFAQFVMSDDPAEPGNYLMTGTF